MEKVSKGQRVTITCQGLTVSGTVISADHETRYHHGEWEIIGYLLEVLSDEGHVHYWKSLIDGGKMTIHYDIQVIEVRIRLEVEDWLDLPVHEYLCKSSEEAAIFCRILFLSTPEAKGLRWNRKGSLQGYYLSKGECHDHPL